MVDDNAEALRQFLVQREQKRWRIIEFVNSSIMLVYHPTYNLQTWMKSKLRKHRTSPCVICGKPCGEYGYRPLGNPANRMLRICVDNHPLNIGRG